MYIVCSIKNIFLLTNLNYGRRRFSYAKYWEMVYFALSTINSVNNSTKYIKNNKIISERKKLALNSCGTVDSGCEMYYVECGRTHIKYSFLGSHIVYDWVPHPIYLIYCRIKINCKS